MKVLLAVTHLLGIGHLSRIAALGRGLVAAGHSVTLVTGGRHAPNLALDGMEVVQLPAVHCVGVDFRTLLDESGLPAPAGLMAARRELLLATLGRAAPDVVVTELFPFGRRQLAGEFTALAEAARCRRPRPALVVSIRDILNPPSRPERAAEALERLGLYDRVIVHGDEALTPLSRSWPVDAALERRLAYTGYISEGGRGAERDAAEIEGGSGEILVSGGGSAASLPLFRAALGAAALLGQRHPWRLLVGHGVDASTFATLQADAPGHVTVERARRDFRDLLARAAVSVSQAGYNTVVDLLQANVPAVVVPFEAGQEREQRWRAECFAERGLVRVLPEDELRPQALADAVADRLRAGRPSGAVRPMLDGVGGSTRLLVAEADRTKAIAAAWERLEAALDGLASAGSRLRIWWRDDDAVRPTPELDRLLALATRHAIPLALAVIPAGAEPGLATRLRECADVDVLQHGFAHADHAPPGAKKIELGGPDRSVRLAELAQGAGRLADLFGTRLVPVLVPPWNRIDPELVAALPGLGFLALSTFGPCRSTQSAPALVQLNTHLDPVAWRSGGGLADEAALIGTLTEAASQRPREPFGLLTHHLVHDPWIWRFVEELLERLAGHPGVVFARPGELVADA